MEWQPIETAPKDGTRYLVIEGEQMWVRNEPPNCYPGEWTWNKARKDWRGGATGGNPTHWMPLPEPPKG